LQLVQRWSLGCNILCKGGVEVSTIFTYYATYANEVKLVYIRVELSRFITQLVQMRSIHTLLTCYYNLADEGGTQSTIFMCTLPWNPNVTVRLGGTLQLCRKKGTLYNIQVVAIIIVERQLFLQHRLISAIVV